MLELPRESCLLFSVVCVRLSYVINCDVRYTVMILFIICQLVCVTDPWAHMSLVHSILSLKLGVTNPQPERPQVPLDAITQANALGIAPNLTMMINQ